jgi:uncharacterized protein YcfL
MRIILVVMIASALSIFAGCLVPRTSGVAVEKGVLYIEDPAMGVNIEMIRDAREKTPDGFLRAQVFVKNTNRTDYKCQYRFEWLRANGMRQTHAETPWRSIELRGRETAVMEAVSPLQGTEDFRLSIRRN